MAGEYTGTTFKEHLKKQFFVYLVTCMAWRMKSMKTWASRSGNYMYEPWCPNS